MASFKLVETTIRIKKFDSLTLVENGLILNNGKKGEKEIPFSELDKIYIKKYKLYPVFEFLFISLPFILTYIVIQYCPSDLVWLASLFTIFPVFMTVNNYKWFKLKVCLNDGTYFMKTISLHLKSENINIVKNVQTEYYNYKINKLASENNKLNFRRNRI
jgi:hypothetical protein